MAVINSALTAVVGDADEKTMVGVPFRRGEEVFARRCRGSAAPTVDTGRRGLRRTVALVVERAPTGTAVTGGRKAMVAEAKDWRR